MSDTCVVRPDQALDANGHARGGHARHGFAAPESFRSARFARVKLAKSDPTQRPR